MTSTSKNVLLIVGGVTLTAVAFVVIPPIIDAVSNKLYRAQGGTSDIDFDDLGPKIVRKDEEG